MITLISSALVYTVLSAVFYHQRGGAFDAYLERFEKFIGFKIFPRNLIVVGVLQIPLITYGFLWINGCEWLPALIISLATGLGYILYLLRGWGDYFDMGTFYIDVGEIGFIDAITKKIYGPSDPQNFAVRRKRDIFSMGLRMGVFAPLLFGLIGAAKIYFGANVVTTVLLVLALSIAASAVTFIYAYFVNQKTIFTHGENIKRAQSMNKQVVWHSNPIARAEVVTGAYLAILILILLIL